MTLAQVPYEERAQADRPSFQKGGRQKEMVSLKWGQMVVQTTRVDWVTAHVDQSLKVRSWMVNLAQGKARLALNH